MVAKRTKETDQSCTQLLVSECWRSLYKCTYVYVGWSEFPRPHLIEVAFRFVGIIAHRLQACIKDVTSFGGGHGRSCCVSPYFLCAGAVCWDWLSTMNVGQQASVTVHSGSHNDNERNYFKNGPLSIPQWWWRTNRNPKATPFVRVGC